MMSPSLTFIVRWQSALPVKIATVRQRLGDEADSSESAKKFLATEEKEYVIAVVGVQPAPEDAQPTPEMIEKLKESTTLSWKGQTEALHPASVLLPRRNSAALIYKFPKDHPIDLECKEVEFATRRGPLEIKKRFRLKDMVYQGQLSL